MNQNPYPPEVLNSVIRFLMKLHAGSRRQAGRAVEIGLSPVITPTGAIAPEIISAIDHGALTGLADDDHPQYATDADLTAHAGAADPHTVYQKESEKGAANGYASLGADTLVPQEQLGTGTQTGTKFLRDDGTWQPAPGSGQAEFSVTEVDGVPSVTPITIIRFPNGTVTDNGGGDVTYTPAAGGGGATVYTSAYASPPATPSAGDVWLPSDTPYVFRYSGTVWVPWGPIWPCGLLANHPTTWVNQGTASMSQANAMTTITAPTASNPTWRLLVKAAPATPYTITARIMGAGPLAYMPALVARASGSGSFVTLRPETSTLNVTNYTSPTVISTTPASTSILAQMGPFWYRLTDDGTNRIWSYSQDGFNFTTLYTIGRTTFITADQVGFGINPNNAGVTTYASLVSWVES